jgi:hypothetical protein
VSLPTGQYSLTRSGRLERPCCPSLKLTLKPPSCQTRSGHILRGCRKFNQNQWHPPPLGRTRSPAQFEEGCTKHETPLASTILSPVRFPLDCCPLCAFCTVTKPSIVFRPFCNALSCLSEGLYLLNHLLISCFTSLSTLEPEN